MDNISWWRTQFHYEIISRTLFHYEIISMDNISYDILSGGHYFIETLFYVTYSTCDVCLRIQYWEYRDNKCGLFLSNIFSNYNISFSKLLLIKWKNEKYHTYRKILKSCWKNRRNKGKIDTPNTVTHEYMAAQIPLTL